jgi:hypothetical protein
MEEFKGALPPAEKWVFIRRSLIFRVGGGRYNKINNSRIIRQGNLQIALKFIAL